MPTPIMHMALAQEILSGDALPPAVHRLLMRQHGPFLLGHTSPDVQTVSGQAREETHFYALPHVRCRTRDRPAHETLFAAHPDLARAESLPAPQAAFVAGYIAHLLLDELWLDAVFLPYFRQQEWGTRRERAFLHNVLRTWLDQRDLERIDGTVMGALRQVRPSEWLPFVRDEDLSAWRDWLVGQLSPGHAVQTAEVFAERMGVRPAEVEAVMQSSEKMAERVFSHVPEAVLRSYHDEGHERSVALIAEFLTRRQR
jgi:hypothetical protein